MRVEFSSRSWEEYRYFQANDVKLLHKLNTLIKECRRSPFRGLGKLEPLGGNLKGFWSRRVDQEHRLVYRVSGSGDAQALQIAQCRYHY